MTSSRLFHSKENPPIAIFNQVKKDINFAMSLAVHLSDKNDTEIYEAKKTENDLFAMRRESAALIAQIGTTEEKEEKARNTEKFIILENIGICHIIDCINLYTNNLKIPSPPKESQIDTLLPSHRLFLKRVQPKQNTLAVVTSKIVKSALITAGYSYSLHVLSNSHRQESLAIFAVIILSICWLTQQMLKPAPSEQVKFMREFFGSRFEYIKELCAKCHEIENHKISGHTFLIENDTPSFQAGRSYS